MNATCGVVSKAAAFQDLDAALLAKQENTIKVMMTQSVSSLGMNFSHRSTGSSVGLWRISNRESDA